MTEYGDRLTAVLRDAGVTQEQLAEFAGIAQETVSRIRTGDTAEPKVKTWTRIASVFGLTGDELLRGEPTRKIYDAKSKLMVDREPETGGGHRIDRSEADMPAATIDGDADDETPLERAITVAFDPMEYSRHDLNAAAIAARTLHRWSDPLSDPSWAADFLRAARTLRLRREDATPQAVKDGVLMARMRMGPRELDAATKVANDEARRLSEEFDEPSTGKVK